jgi:anti-sigma-K factor RskA
MNDFDTKWQACATRARQAARRDEQAPFGFATRVVARASQPGTTPAEFAWDRWLARLLAGAVAVLVVCSAVELPHLRDAQPLEPGIENAVAQLVWSL